MQSGSAKSFADDLGTSRGVVPSRAATTLRSIETKPLTGGFVRLKDGRLLARSRRRQEKRQAPAGPSLERNTCHDKICSMPTRRSDD
jgi:hypothetical protein